MIKNKKLRHGLFSLTVLFTSLASSQAMAYGPEHDIEGTWKNDEIGTVEIQPCKNNQSKFCGYLLDASPTAIEEFKLRVDKTSQNIRGLLVMDNLTLDEDGNKLTGGKFQNTDSSQAQSATLTIKYQGTAINVRASIGWFGENFKFTKASPTYQYAQQRNPASPNSHNKI